ncbi:MAG: aminoacetone oxidase family FAD-binding enzyme [Bacteroidales bacterium]|nr:aminoacetone oxidase family FAD-binding enzyme [Bacteroidales bacterium]
MKAAIVGAGASGCFCAAVLHQLAPEIQVTLFEKGRIPMAKLALTGGGRCNLTNTFESAGDLSKIYPRGYQVMRRALKSFGPKQIMEWFENAGVRLKEEDNGRIFPCSDDAMEIVGTILRNMGGAEIRTGCMIKSLDELNGYDAIVLTSGGGTAELVRNKDIEIIPQTPSLFTFNLSDKAIRQMSGITLKDVSVSLSGTKFKADGDILVTHWGISGPAILKLSSYAAVYLAENGYHATLSINYHIGDIEQTRQANLQKLVRSTHPDDIPARFWEYLIGKSGLRPDIRWAEMGSKGLNRLRNTLSDDKYEISGKGNFKDEFVTCGGISLDEINPNTMESQKCPGLYFAGEVLDIDAITGGYNLQAAWSTAYLAARSIAE